MPYEDKVFEFKRRIDAGEKIEAGDWMPDEYRLSALKFIEMHANSEVMGALPEREWIPRAPTLKRKLSLTAKVQDEVGHGQILYRVAEDLGKSREQMFDDLVNGRTKFHAALATPGSSNVANSEGSILRMAPLGFQNVPTMPRTISRSGSSPSQTKPARTRSSSVMLRRGRRRRRRARGIPRAANSARIILDRARSNRRVAS